jgi:hypothetical protein
MDVFSSIAEQFYPSITILENDNIPEGYDAVPVDHERGPLVGGGFCIIA